MTRDISWSEEQHIRKNEADRMKEHIWEAFRQIELKAFTRIGPDLHHPDFCHGYVQGLRVARDIMRKHLREYEQSR